MPSLQHAGFVAHYAETGNGDPVMLLHAGASSARQWRKMSPQLAEHFRLLAPDLIGFGDTPPWSGPDDLTHDDQAALVRELMRTADARPAHLVGHSYGGATAVRVALTVPEAVRGLVLIEPIMMPLLHQAGERGLFDEYRTFAERFIAEVDAGRDEAAMRFFIDHRNGAGTWATSSSESRAKLVAVARQTANAFTSNLNNPTTLSDCASITAPTLIVCGAETTEPERIVTRILQDAIADAGYAVVKGAGHMSPLTHPAGVARLIIAHLARC